MFFDMGNQTTHIDAVSMCVDLGWWGGQTAEKYFLKVIVKARTSVSYLCLLLTFLVRRIIFFIFLYKHLPCSRFLVLATILTSLSLGQLLWSRLKYQSNTALQKAIGEFATIFMAHRGILLWWPPYFLLFSRSNLFTCPVKYQNLLDGFV